MSKSCPFCKNSCKAPPGKITELLQEVGEFKKARRALASGAKSYTIDNRSLTRTDLSTIKEAIEDIQNEIAAWCQYGAPFPPPGRRVIRVFPVDGAL